MSHTGKQTHSHQHEKSPPGVAGPRAGRGWAWGPVVFLIMHHRIRLEGLNEILNRITPRELQRGTRGPLTAKAIARLCRARRAPRAATETQNGDLVWWVSGRRAHRELRSPGRTRGED